MECDHFGSVGVMMWGGIMVGGPMPLHFCNSKSDWPEIIWRALRILHETTEVHADGTFYLWAIMSNHINLVDEFFKMEKTSKYHG